MSFRKIIGFVLDQKEFEELQLAFQNGQFDFETEVYSRFDSYVVIVFKDDAMSIFLRFDDLPQLSFREIREVRDAAAKKPRRITSPEATIARQRYNNIEKIDVITNSRRRGAHKAHVTRAEFAQRRDNGDFSHKWRIDYTYDDIAYNSIGKALSYSNARYEAGKFFKKKILKFYPTASLTNTSVARLEA